MGDGAKMKCRGEVVGGMEDGEEGGGVNIWMKYAEVGGNTQRRHFSARSYIPLG